MVAPLPLGTAVQISEVPIGQPSGRLPAQFLLALPITGHRAGD